ncbi:hypothetical protein Taro_047164 [Colocasia esculenta]|uniref:Membrane magnesium transporter n=1 Tax=Colocasia esculenta TaxID=4460 RepID=A0A843X537_COLES|nr:hypothetical protein [Colocasia esculenta]
MGATFVVGILGGLLLAHAAYSTIQCNISIRLLLSLFDAAVCSKIMLFSANRGVLKIVEEEFSGPPLNVVLELLVGLALSVWAGLYVPGRFVSILPDSEDNRIVALPVNLDFMIFNHRGRAIPANAELKLHT